MSNMIKMPIRYTIATLYKQGISKREIARPLAVHRENVNRYLKRMTEKSQPEAPLLVSQEKNVEICEQTDTANDQLSASEWESGVVAGFENQPGAPLSKNEELEKATGMNPSDAIPLQSFEQWEAPLDILMREMQPGIGNRESTSTQSNPSGVDSDENARNGISSLYDPFRKLIEEMVAKNLNEKRIWQDLVHDHRFQGKYRSVRRYERQMRENNLPVNDLEFPTKITTTYALWVSHLDVIGLNDGSVDELPPDLFTIVPRCRSEWGTAIDQSKRNQFQHNPKWSLCKSHISFVHTARIVSIAIRTNCSHHFE